MAVLSPIKLGQILNDEAGIRLLRARSAPIVISFLYNTFRKNNTQEMPYEVFRLALEDFLTEHVSEEETIESDIDEENIQLMDIASRVKTYSEDWFSEEKRYIFRYYNQNKEEMIRPSPSLIRVFSYIDNIMESDFISTDSSFNFILTQLRTLSENMNKDPESKIRELKEKIKELETEILEIETTGKVKTYDNRRIIEYLTDLKRKSRDMLGEFSQVEENFKEIMTQIAKKQASEDISKRMLLGYSLDLYRELNNSPQGQSFNGFWGYISTNSEDEITALSEEIISTIIENNIDYDASFLLNLRSSLFAAGNRVVEKNHILTDRMNRVMAQTNRTDRKGLDALYAKIKSKNAEILSNGSDFNDNNFIFIDDIKASLSFPLSKPLRAETEERTTSTILFEEKKDILSQIRALASEFKVDEKKLRDNIFSFSQENKIKTFTLKELTDRYPITKGLEEIVSYISVFRDYCTSVDISDTSTEEIKYLWNSDKYFCVTLPTITIHI